MSGDAGNFFKGFLIGGAMGLVAGLLFAPKTGRDMREDLIQDSDELIKKTKKEMDKVLDELSDLKEKLYRKSTATKPSQTAEERDFEAGINSMDNDDQTTTVHTKKGK